MFCTARSEGGGAEQLYTNEFSYGNGVDVASVVEKRKQLPVVGIVQFTASHRATELRILLFGRTCTILRGKSFQTL